MSRARSVNRNRVRKLPHLVRHFCPLHGPYATRYEPAPCKHCEPVLYDTLFPQRPAHADDHDSE